MVFKWQTNLYSNGNKLHSNGIQIALKLHLKRYTNWLFKFPIFRIRLFIKLFQIKVSMGHHILCLHCNMHPCVGFYLLVYFLFHWFSCAGASQHFAILFIFHLTPQDDCVAGPSTLSICGQNYEIFSKLSYWSPQCFPLPYLSKIPKKSRNVLQVPPTPYRADEKWRHLFFLFLHIYCIVPCFSFLLKL